MYTLVYLKGHLNRPDTLVSFLNSSVGTSPLLRVDCITPFTGTEQELIKEVCNHLSGTVPHIEVVYKMTQNISTEDTKNGFLVQFLVIQITINER